jgi:transcriptional regulator with XRE-family HTH domain
MSFDDAPEEALETMLERRVLKKKLAGRMAEACELANKTSAMIAREIGVDEATVSRWLNPEEKPLPRLDLFIRFCKATGVSAESLLATEKQQEYETDASETGSWVWRWREQAPETSDLDDRQDYQKGIELFYSCLPHLADETTRLNQPPPRSSVELNRCFRAAISSGALQILDIPRDTKREAQIRERYSTGGRILAEGDVFVAALPKDLNGNWTTSNIVRVEFVAFLTAKYPLGLHSDLHGQNVGIGSGYTVLRCMELTDPSTRRFSGTQFIPLMTVNDPDHDHVTTSTNYTAAFMASRHPASKAFRLPYIPPERRESIIYDDSGLTAAEKVAKQTKRETGDSLTVFMSVGGVESDPTQSNDSMSFEAQHYRFTLGTLQLIWRRLKHIGYKDDFAVEILGLMLNDNLQIVGNKDAQDYNLRQIYTIIGPDRLQQLVASGDKVWIVAAGHHKRQPTLTALKTGLANALVIDSEIAEYLIQNADEVSS